MFLYLFKIVLIILYTTIIGASKCNKYIIIIPGDPMCSPIKFNDINWDSVDCPRDDSTAVMTYNEIYANRSCILELGYENSETKCKSKKNPSIYRYHETITTEASKLTENDIIGPREEENSTDVSKSFVWNCDYTIYNSEIVCDSFQTRKYKMLQFLNCTEDEENQCKKEKFKHNDFSINLRTDISSNENIEHTDIKKYGPFNEDLELSFIFDGKDCNKPLPPLRISKSKMFNLWTDDEENIMRKYHNNFSLKFHLSNCTTVFDSILALGNHSNKDLIIDVILNNKNNTNINIFIEKDSNETENMNRFIVNCIYPALEEGNIIDNKNLKHNLELDCEFKDLDDVVTNYSLTTESYGDSNKDLIYTTVLNPFISTEIENSENVINESYNSTEHTESATYIYYKSHTESLETIPLEPADPTEKDQEGLLVTNKITETTTTNYKNNYFIAKHEKDEDGSHIKPIVYIAIILAIIGFASVATIIGLKIWKPTTVYYAIPRTNPRVTEDSSL